MEGRVGGGARRVRLELSSAPLRGDKTSKNTTLALTVLTYSVGASLATLALQADGTLVLLSARTGTGPVVGGGKSYGMPGERRPSGLYLRFLREMVDAALEEESPMCRPNVPGTRCKGFPP
jgi:hypothetical protein